MSIRKSGLIFVLMLFSLACNFSWQTLIGDDVPQPTEQVAVATTPPPVTVVVITSTPAPPTITPSPQFSPTPSGTPFIEPAGCLRPPDDYARVQIGDATLNARTYWMLERAAELYGGTIPITGAGIMQGSYNVSVSASFGTHDGGGAVDLTVRNIPYTFELKSEDIPILIDALQLAGFAAWYRDERESLPAHIHAIAIGDADLSEAAQLQLTGRYGYFRGFDGFPRADGVPLTARHGGLVICQWMLDMGYRDMRGEPLPDE